MTPTDLGDVALDPNHWVTEEFDGSGGPHYTISEFAKFFFNRTSAWVRWRERHGWFILDADHYEPKTKTWIAGDKSECFGTNRTQEDARYYTLRDAEGIAHALAQKGAINGAQLHLVSYTVYFQAKIFGHI